MSCAAALILWACVRRWRRSPRKGSCCSYVLARSHPSQNDNERQLLLSHWWVDFGKKLGTLSVQLVPVSEGKSEKQSRGPVICEKTPRLSKRQNVMSTRGSVMRKATRMKTKTATTTKSGAMFFVLEKDGLYKTSGYKYCFHTCLLGHGGFRVNKESCLLPFTHCYPSTTPCVLYARVLRNAQCFSPSTT